MKCKNEDGFIDYSSLAPTVVRAFLPAPYFMCLRGTDLFTEIRIPEKRPRVKHAKDPIEEKTKPSAVSF